MYENGLKHGPGKYFHENGQVFEGIYVHDKRLGEGKITFRNGD
jgi:antitoxin component YwqK of YwqJK toxin-antitoxin module